jgi:SSS family solute:Na+ symporter
MPFLFILPGAIAISLPTPQSTTVVRDVNGIIYHEITVVPPEAAQGSGMIPARLDPATGKPQLSAAGQVLLNYDMATPTMVMHFLPTGLLGLGVAALLASLMSGLAASVTALNAVITFDIYEPFIRKGADGRHSLAVGRVAAVGAIALSIGVAYAIAGLKGIALESVFVSVLLVFSLGNAPQFATFLLGMFTKRTTGHGAFAGLVAGIAGALLHHGLTLPVDAQPGLQGGWIAVLHRYPGFVAQCLWTAMIGFAANAIVASAVSLCTNARPQKELKGLVHRPKKRAAVQVWWKRPEAFAIGILLAAVVLGALFI